MHPSSKDGVCCDQPDASWSASVYVLQSWSQTSVVSSHLQCQHWPHSSFSAQSQVFVNIWELCTFQRCHLGWSVGPAVVVSVWMKRHIAVTRKTWFIQKPNWKISKGFFYSHQENQSFSIFCTVVLTGYFYRQKQLVYVGNNHKGKLSSLISCNHFIR